MRYIDKIFTDKYKSFIDQYEEEYEKVKMNKENKKNWLKYSFKYIK